MKRVREAMAVMALLMPLLSACGKTPAVDDPLHDVRTETRREQNCANPQWKAANLGLWYNLCQTNTY